MTANDPVIAALADANPVLDAIRPGPLERAEADGILRRVLSTPSPSRHHASVLVPVLSTLLVLAVAAVLLRSNGATHRSSAGQNGFRLTFRTLPTEQSPVISAAAMSREVDMLRERLASVHGSFRVSLASDDRIAVTAAHITSGARARIVDLVTDRAELLFYDWEANALTPNGHTVASQLAAQNTTALQISQGSGQQPGTAGVGSMSLYSAVSLAATQPPAPASTQLSRIGPQYYMFGAPGSAACAVVATAQRSAPIPGDHCLLAGPDSETSTTTRRQAINNLVAHLPPGVNRADGHVLVVPQGTVVLQAASHAPADQVPFTSPTAQFYVLRDRVALSGNDITNPQPGTDQAGSPEIQFGFTQAGRNAFQSLTNQIAHRGASISVAGGTYDQHFAAVLGSRLLTVASIDFKQYPDGITAGGGADIITGTTPQSARTLATELRLGTPPLQLRLAP